MPTTQSPPPITASKLIVIEHDELPFESANKITAATIQDVATKLTEEHSTLIVFTNSPLGNFGMVRKYWYRFMRKLENEKASTLDPIKQRILGHRLEVMRDLPFELFCPGSDDWGVFFVEPGQCTAGAAEIQT